VKTETDADLVGRTRDGDREAYGELVARYQGHVYALAYSLVDNWAEAQDIAQETFVRAYMNLEGLRESARFPGWLRRVTFSVAMKWMKAYRPELFRQLDGRVDLDTLEIPDFRPGPPEVVEKRELARAVQGAIAALPAKYRVPLTMFHLDGLSYQKVADFLDIPLGTAKSLLHRARAKLKGALADYASEEVTPMVQEVFDEHRLPEEFAQKVLEGVSDLRYDEGDLTFVGALMSLLKFMGEEVSKDYVMGASGGAFKLLWHPQWCPSSGDLVVLGEEPIRRVFQAIGRDYEMVMRAEGDAQAAELRQRLMESINRGRPVLAFGVVGPETCVVAGYEEEGTVALGHSYFHDGSQGYFRKGNWWEEADPSDEVGEFAHGCGGIVTVGEKVKTPSDILRATLDWAVELIRAPERDGYVSGLAAYDAWAAALQRDEDFPAGDLEALDFRCLVNANVLLCVLKEARASAAGFLREMAQEGVPGRDELMAAAVAYQEEAEIVVEAEELAPYTWHPEERRLQMADPDLRARLAALVLQAKEKDAQALAHLEKARQGMAG
jgi:RNA polymerase sigma factor (sigma-70 family)